MRRLPALVAAVTGSRWRHPSPASMRTWLDPTSVPRRRILNRPRKALGPRARTCRPFRQLRRRRASLLVGEGIETVLSHGYGHHPTSRRRRGAVRGKPRRIRASCPASPGIVIAQGQRRRRRARGSCASPGAARGRASPPPVISPAWCRLQRAISLTFGPAGASRQPRADLPPPGLRRGPVVTIAR